MGQPQTLTPGRFVDFRDQMSSIASMAGVCQFGMTLTGGGDPELIDASSVSSNFFDVLGARPLLGDPFHGGTADERAVVLVTVSGRGGLARTPPSSGVTSR